MEQKSYSVPEAAKMLCIAVRTVRKWIADGKIRAEKSDGGNRWQITASEIDRLNAGK